MTTEEDFTNLETVNITRDGAVVFAEIAAPPMNLLGPELIRDWLPDKSCRDEAGPAGL